MSKMPFKCLEFRFYVLWQNRPNGIRINWAEAQMQIIVDIS